ncbi:MAG: M48 family metalloprotease [Steroidobacteraceae bacterium]
MRHAVLIILATAFATAAAAQSTPDLPDIGSPADATLAQGDEYRIGAMIVRQLRDQNQILEDPEVDEYLQAVGSRLAAHGSDGGQRFTFFVVREPGINAFALPGGFIGINHGLLLATRNESELASVLAHEIAHVTQRHIARTIRAQGRQSLASAAAVLAAVLIGATTGAGGDAIQGAIAAAQGIAAQQRINFTRANEYEADRVGIGFLASAGFEPAAMADFFETMGRRSGLGGTQLPEFFQTHPVTSNRIAESRSRAAHYERKRIEDSTGYLLARERLRVLSAPRDAQPGDASSRAAERRDRGALQDQYADALTLMQEGEPGAAAEILAGLLERHEGVTVLYSALGQAQMAAGLQSDALATFDHAIGLFPRNVPLSVRYAEALMAGGRAKDAHTLLLDVFNNVPPTPAQIRLTALAASAAGDTGDAYYYMSEYHIASGDIALAGQQLELALAAPNLTAVQRERFRARLAEVREYLLSDRNARRRAVASDDKRGR